MPKESIRAEAERLGFDAVGFATATLPPGTAENLAAFLGDRRHGDMDWLVRHADRRGDVAALWPEAKSAIVIGINYGNDGQGLENLPNRSKANISVYARGADYHDVVKAKLKQLGRFVAESFAADVKVFVDTAPLMEKPLAQSAGIGWQGKHTNLVSREWGSWLFLGAVLTTLDLPPDGAETDHCGNCRQCLDACPTNAFTGPYRIDARRCISYLTIEHKGHIAREFRAAMGNRIYGCDDCLAACPWNKFAKTAREARFHAREELREPDLAGLSRLDDQEFRAQFRGSPIKRTGRNRFVRNVLIAIGNSADANLVPDAERLLGDASPLVRAMAVWALKQLLDPEKFEPLRERYLGSEHDEDVRAEWLEIALNPR